MTDNKDNFSKSQIQEIVKTINELTADMKASVAITTPKPANQEIRKDSPDIPVRKIYDGKIIENSVQVPAKPPLERKSFGLLAAQSMLDEINNKKN